MVVSLMADNDKKSWHELIKKVEDTGAHGLGIEFWLPAWNDGKRHGRCSWTGS